MYTSLKDAKSDALRFTCAFTRQHPRLAAWQHDADTAHQSVLREWHAHPSVALYLAGHERRADGLLKAGAQFLSGEQQLVAAAWQVLAGSDRIKGMPRSAAHLIERLYARARDHGPNVPMCHDLAIAMIEDKYGVRYSKNTITQAREWLVRHGVLEATVGIPWTPGVKSLPTVYHVLATLREEAKALVSTSELCPMAVSAAGHSSPGGWQVAAPRLSDRERALMLLKIEELRALRRRQEEISLLTRVKLACTVCL